MKVMKALFHVNETEKWKMALANMNNLISDVGIDNVIIELVVNGAAVVSAGVTELISRQQEGYSYIKP